MATARRSPLTNYLREISAAHLAALTDGQLLQRFTAQRDEAAFAALVRRHGPLVLGACCRVLRDWHNAEDAFQGTFLLLARRAGSLRRPEALGPWLYGVASRTARKARAREARRRDCERRAGTTPLMEDADDLVWRDLRPVLDEAVARLPEKYRIAFVLHHLQGLAVAEVALRLGCPQGTVAGRLARAKVRLRGRLARQGLAMSATALAAVLAQGAVSAAVPAQLTTGTVEAALRVAAAKTAGALSATAAILTRGGLQAMSLSKVNVGLAVLLAATTLSVGVIVCRRERPDGSQDVANLASKPRTREENGTRSPRGHAPAYERYYAGGLHSTRGFEFRGVAPKAGRAGVEGSDAFNTESKDIEMRVKETPTGRLLFGLGVNSEAGLVGSIVLNERNFDLFRPPTSLDDIWDYKAFRGGGQELRLEAVPGTQLQRYSATFREPFLFDWPYNLGVNSDVNGFMVGGDFMWLNSAEYQIPVKANDQLYFVDFLDSGTVEPNVSIHNYRVSAGFGARIIIPALGPVPIALDFGFPIVRADTDRTQLFSFWLGFFA
jgi:RNA polymerase sigma factor (sigma-70 family)